MTEDINSANLGRRRFLKVSGAAIGGIAAGSSVVAAESADRYIVDAKKVDDANGVEVVHRLDPVDLLVVRGSESDVKALGASYAPDMVYSVDLPAEPEAATESATDEPLYPLQWDKQDLEVPRAHETTRGEDTRVAIIDTGVDETHPDLQAALNVPLSRNFTDDGGDHNPAPGEYHGTHVAGIVAADDTNERGVVGTAPGTELVDCRVFSSEGGATFGDVLAAIVYSAQVGCDAANLSLGAYPVDRRANGKFYGATLNRTMTYANSQGTLLVISAGNDYADLQHDDSFVADVDGDGQAELIELQTGHWMVLPAEGARALTVSATGPVGFMSGEEGLEAPPHAPAPYTNYGTNVVDLGAPGGNTSAEGTAADWVYSTIPLSVAEALNFPVPYAYLAGTSMAAPNVAGAAALVKSANPDYNANQVRSALENAAEVPEGYEKTYYGSGYLNVLDAL